jgi:uncharacterized protein (TIGR04255 family)
VNEVALSVQFSPIAGMTVARFGALWSFYNPPFSKTEDKPPIPSMIETFESARPQKLKFELVAEAQPTRCWFIAEDDSGLIQVQSDRFVFNWRKGEPPAKYPRYEQVREGFVTHFGVFEKYISDQRLGPIVPTQCEVTYVNDLPVNEGWSDHGELENIVAPWSGKRSDDFLQKPEDVQIRGRHVIRAPDGRPLGRLHFNIEPRIRVSDGVPSLRLVLTARGAPIGEGNAGVLAFLDLGREYVVRGFTSLTTPEMHRIWGRNS